MPLNNLIIYKKTELSRKWSNIITRNVTLLEKADGFTSASYVKSTIWEFVRLNYNLITNHLNSKNIILHHAISFYMALPYLFLAKLLGCHIVYLMHEHEHILGLRYFIKYRRKLGWRYSVRACEYYYSLPIGLAHKIVGLSDLQYVEAMKNKFSSYPFLYFDKNAISKLKSNRSSVSTSSEVMFPHDKSRFDKGYRKAKHIENLILGYDVPVADGNYFGKYQRCKFIVLPSDMESYSLVFWEAFISGNIIFCTKNVGALQYLNQDFDFQYYGVFVTDDFDLVEEKVREINKKNNINLNQILGRRDELLPSIFNRNEETFLMELKRVCDLR